MRLEHLLAESLTADELRLLDDIFAQGGYVRRKPVDSLRSLRLVGRARPDACERITALGRNVLATAKQLQRGRMPAPAASLAFS